MHPGHPLARTISVALATASMLVAGAQPPGPPLDRANHADKVPPTGIVAPDDVQFAGYRSPGTRHKLRIDAGQRPALRSIALFARQDYDAFSVVDIDSADLPGLLAHGASLADYQNLILLNSGVIDTRSPEALGLASTPTPAGDRRSMHLVQFAAPLRAAWHRDLVDAGMHIISAIQHNAVLVYADAAARGRLAALHTQDHVQFVAPYLAAQRVHPRLLADGGGMLAVQLVEDDIANAETLAVVHAVATGEVSVQRRAHYVNVRFHGRAGAIAVLSVRDDVVSINPDGDTRPLDERQNRIVTGFLDGNQPLAGDHLAWLAGRGFTQEQFTTSGFVVNVVDSGVDNATTAPNHFGLYTAGDNASASRIAFARVLGNAGTSAGRGVDGHGTLNAHIVGGYVPGGAPFNVAPHADAQGFRYGLGVAPFVLLGASTIFDPWFTDPDPVALERAAWADGARISTNSWGNTVIGDYTARAQTYDALVRDAAEDLAGNQQLVIVFSAGNSGPAAATVREPGVAKNVITVGASEGVQAFGAADGCAVGDNGANSANDIISFSSRGPATGGRRKPDLVAPGTHISGGVWQHAPPPSPWSTGLAATGFTADGICGGPPPSRFWPLEQQWYSASSGTSHSTPAVAGGAALLRQHFINSGAEPPSPAMTKAVLMNSARHLTGVGANDTLWSNTQGMGLMDLGRALDTTPRILRDQLAADRLLESGQIRTVTGTVVHADVPVRVTLAWTDAPGPTSGAPQLNDLDLVVDVDGAQYLGNVFAGAHSISGGSADTANNVESVFIPPAIAAGTRFAIRVSAASLIADGVPGNGDALDQDFALVVHNAQASDFPYITSTALTLVAENAAPANGVPDPGERLTYDLALRNIGTTTPLATLATLRSSDGVIAAGPPRDYGALVAGGDATTLTHTFTIDPALACGSEVDAIWDLVDGTTALGTVRHRLRLGILEVALDEGFDTSAAPALPPAWQTSVSGSGSPWTSVIGNSWNGTQAASASAPASISDKLLHSPAVAIDTAEAVLAFRHRFNFENGFDGAVLEMRIGAGPFTDVLSAGAQFLTGGYTGTISTEWNSPIGGRAAWTGNSGAYREVRLALPASAQGQLVQLRWRLATDVSLSVSGAGQWIDAVELFDGHRCAVAPDRIFADGFD